MEQYIYYSNYQDYEEDLFSLEMRSLFNRSIQTKVFLSHRRIDESISPYFKSRLEVLHSSTTFDGLIQSIIEEKYKVEGFIVQYLSVAKIDPVDKDRYIITKAVGNSIEGFPSYKNPEIIYGVTFYKDKWYFGIVVYSIMNWKKHISKPYSYSSSLGINTAKAIINIAARGDISKKIIDPCCGVGTVLLEGHYSGYDIIGCEINEKVAIKASENLKHYGYQGQVIKCEIKDIYEAYDAAVIDLPYGNFCPSDEANILDIIHHASRISERQVFISAIDLTEQILEEGLVIIDRAIVYKNQSRKFFRHIWVCEGLRT